MSTALEIDLAPAEGRLAELWEKVREMPAQASLRSLQAIDRASEYIVGLAQKERFTGKGPFPASMRKLGVVSGRLRRSLRATKPEVTGEGEVTVKFGTEVEYWPIHEFGFSGRVQVKAHKRASRGGGTHDVTAHSRRVEVAARSPFQAAIEDHGQREYEEAIMEGLKELLEEVIA